MLHIITTQFNIKPQLQVKFISIKYIPTFHLDKIKFIKRIKTIIHVTLVSVKKNKRKKKENTPVLPNHEKVA